MLVMLTATLGLSMFAHAAPNSGPIPGRFIVKLSPKANMSGLAQSLGTDASLVPLSQLIMRTDIVRGDLWNRYVRVRGTKTDVTSDDIIEMLGAHNIEHIEEEYWLEFFDYPSDPLFAHQWYLYNTAQEYLSVERVPGNFNDTLRTRSGTAGEDIGISFLYDSLPAQSTRVVVAIIDSGVDLVHPDLQGQFWINQDEIPGNGLDDDHNGFTDDTLGYDVSGDSLSLGLLEGDNDPTDVFGHGTHIAGIVAAAANSQGTVGVAPNAEIMAIKVRPNATTAVGAAGIVYAINSGADIISISWGTPFESQLLSDVLDLARANNVFVAIAAGNTGGHDIFYPAAYDSAFAIAASESNGNLTYFSTWGEHIDIVAPGEDILSLRAKGTDMYRSIGEPNVRIVGADSNYYLSDGTSMSCPMVSGAAARLLSIRPDLTLSQLENVLRLGARDLIDPLNVGDSLPGVDSVSGWGLLDLENSLSLVVNGGMYFTSPQSHDRYVEPVVIKAAAIGEYAGGWQLDYTVDAEPYNWQPLAGSTSLPPDSILHLFDEPSLSGHIRLRLTDDFGIKRELRFAYVSSQAVALTSPSPGLEYQYSIPAIGSVYGADLDSASLFYNPVGGSQTILHTTTGEFFDSLIYLWNASGLELGEYTLSLHGYFESGELVDSSTFTITSAFAEGWPQTLSGRGALTAVCADLNNDGTKEIIAGTSFGLNVFGPQGQILAGFPAMPEHDMRSIPAVYDIDGDGENEIICTGDDGLYVINYDGSPAPGWPVSCVTGRTGLGYPNPTITRLGPDKDSAIVLINGRGDVLAYTFAGDSYFYSLEGWFASFGPQPTGTFYYGLNSVAGVDLDGDNRNELVLSYSATYPSGGVGVFDGRTGQPAFDRASPQILEANVVYGSSLADLNNDGHPEIITSGYDSTGLRTLWAKTHDLLDLPGFPVTLPDVGGYRGNAPTIADLDLDGWPEILISFFEFDIGVIYAFRSDGTPYRQIEGRPTGEVFRDGSTFGTPIVANLLGDERPEVVMRSGYLFPGTGSEQVHLLDYQFQPIAGWPVATPTLPMQVFSTPYAPMVDDIDGDGLVELVLVSEGFAVYIWDFEAPSNGGKNVGRLLMDNTNSNQLPPSDIPTTVDEPTDLLPTSFVLYQNYPNPFNPTTTISFDLTSRAMVKLQVINILGQIVTTLINQQLAPGSYHHDFDGTALASGIYLYRLTAGDQVATQKMVLLK